MERIIVRKSVRELKNKGRMRNEKKSIGSSRIGFGPVGGDSDFDRVRADFRQRNEGRKSDSGSGVRSVRGDGRRYRECEEDASRKAEDIR